MDVSQYLEIFIDESNEHLQNLSDGIMILEKEPDNSDTINEIFRAAHSLKGMAGTMGYKRMQNLTHDMENVFSEVRNGNIKVDSRMVDVLFQCLDALEQYVNNIQETSDEGTDDNEPIIKALNSFIVKIREYYLRKLIRKKLLQKRRKRKAQMLQVLMPDIITWYLLILKRMLLTKQLRRR